MSSHKTTPPTATIRAVIDAYDAPIVRAYCRGRFLILRQRFLTEIGQYFPERGRVLDIGCGFGLFSLYYALRNPELEFLGVDLNARRIEMAQKAATQLGIANARYEVGDARTLIPDSSLDGAYMMDIIHHIPRAAVEPLLSRLHASLKPGARLIIKDVNTKPTYQRWFTWWLDKAMDPQAEVDYWHSTELRELLRELGFEVFVHAMVDILPYPHMIYACTKKP
jgi:ubiquinone/menaquinone biosynthesis C-methylase UbiE